MHHTDIPTPAPLLPDDPAQVVFEFPPVTTDPEILPAATPPPAVLGRNVSAQDGTKPSGRRRRLPPKRARISFDAPARLKARLDRTAHELDRSKTIILREALGKYLNALDELGGEP